MSDEIYDIREGRKVLLHPSTLADDVPGLYINESVAVMYSPNGKSSIQISDLGVSIQGPISIQTSPDQIRFAGLWKLNPLLLTTLPSSTYTPVPFLKSSLPKQNPAIVKGIASALALLQA